MRHGCLSTLWEILVSFSFSFTQSEKLTKEKLTEEGLGTTLHIPVCLVG